MVSFDFFAQLSCTRSLLRLDKKYTRTFLRHVSWFTQLSHHLAALLHVFTCARWNYNQRVNLARLFFSYTRSVRLGPAHPPSSGADSLSYSHSSGAQSNIVMADFLRISMRERAPCTLCALDPCAIRSLCTPILLRVVRDASFRQLCLTQHSDGAHSALGALLFSNTLSNVPL